MTQLSLEGIVNSSAKAAAEELVKIVDAYESKRKWNRRSLDTLRRDYQDRLYLHLVFSYTDMSLDDKALREFAQFVGRHQDVIPHLPSAHPKYRAPLIEPDPLDVSATVEVGKTSLTLGCAAAVGAYITGPGLMNSAYVGLGTASILFLAVELIGGVRNWVHRYRRKNYINEIRRFLDEKIYMSRIIPRGRKDG